MCYRAESGVISTGATQPHRVAEWRDPRISSLLPRALNPIESLHANETLCPAASSRMTAPPAIAPAKALFLDRDGVINQEASYLWRREDVRFIPGIFPLCRTAQALGYKLVVVTNQAGIGRGLYTEADFHLLMDWMRSEFARENVTLDAIYFSPWHPEHGVGDYKRDHEDRKPGTGMLRRAAADLDLSLASSILVGDRCTDIAAANSAGLRQAFLIAGTENERACPGQFLPVTTLAEIESWLRANP